MSFLEQVKYVNFAFLFGGVAGLIRLLFVEYDLSFMEDTADWDITESSFNLGRSILMLWEFVWLVLAAAGFWYLARNAEGKADPAKEEKVVNFEVKFFKIMISILVVAAFLTLLVPAFFGDESPIYQYRNSDDATPVYVNSFFFGFSFSFSDNLTEYRGTIELNTDTKYVFKLETNRGDTEEIGTTHGFGLYNDANQLIIQAQIVPDYTTDVVIKFDEAGVYTIKCMEFCGIGHHVMEAIITVV